RVVSVAHLRYEQTTVFSLYNSIRQAVDSVCLGVTFRELRFSGVVLTAPFTVLSAIIPGGKMLPDISREKQLSILRKMLTIRRAEEHVIRFNEEHEGLIRGHFHVYIGQETTGVAVCEALSSKDYVFSTHRN